MSLKQELETWAEALAAYDAQEFERCLDLFENIADSSKILFNIGLVQATIGSHDLAVSNFEAAVQLDEYLAVAYFQSGVSHFLLGRYEKARRDFDEAYTHLRSNQTIDYEQLGLKFRLYACEVLFNRGLSSIYMGNQGEGMEDFAAARKEKQTDDHSVIDEAFSDRGDGYTVFSIPVGVLYRPSANKIKNIKTKDYLGTARLIAATDQRDAFTGFSGSNRSWVPHTSGSDSSRLSAPQASFPERGGLMRAQTSAARMQGESPGLGMAPLRRRATDATSVGKGPTSPGMAPPRRSNTTAGHVARGRPPTPPSSNDGPARPPKPTRRSPDDDYLDSYYNAGGDPVHPSPSGQPRERVANWARDSSDRDPPQLQGPLLSRSTSATSGRSQSRNPVAPLTRISPSTVSTNLPPRSFNGGGSIRRRLVYDDDSGAFIDESHEGSVVAEREMSKIRVKLRFLDDVRGMSILPDLAHEDFAERVRIKFNSPSDLYMKYKDAEGVFVSIVDEGDWESAVDEAREAAKGRAEGKLEIYLT